ncbi:hypothetical protein JCM13304A_16260 [Desulfothermus okinawensis JCM 13304]
MINNITFQDILNNKDYIREKLSNFIKIKDIAIYISNDLSTGQTKRKIQVELLKETRQIIIKVALSNISELVVIAVDLIEPNPLHSDKESLTKIFELIIENIGLMKVSMFEPDIPCLNSSAFLNKLDIKIEQVIAHLNIGTKRLIISDIDFPKGNFSVAGIKFLNSNHLLSKLGFNKWRTLLKEVLIDLKQAVHMEDVFFDKDDHILFAISNNSVKDIRRIHSNLLDKFKKTKTNHLVLKLKPLTLYLKYPNHIPGYLLKLESVDLGYEILKVLKNGLKILENSNNQHSPVSIDYILNNCGFVSKIVNMDSVDINIGEDFGVKCGQFFQVFDSDTNQLKAELIVSHTSRNCSRGDILIRHDPFVPIKTGDPLKLIEDNTKDKEKVPLCKNFILNLYNKIRESKAFSILYTIGTKQNLGDLTHTLNKKNIDTYTETMGIEKSIIIAKDVVIREENSIFKELKKFILCNTNVKIGITNYPLLDLSKLEVIRLSIDSLEHALLIPEPKITIFNSTTFNLRGDKYFIKGDIYSAMEEYKRSIIMDSKNHIALNSLGVCYAKIGDFINALKMFRESLKINLSSTYFYNLGSIYLKLNNLKEAENSFLKCIEIEGTHIFATIRLAQICELKKQFELAKKWLNKIDPTKYPQAYTLLANIYLKQKKQKRAKEYLESAIRLNPNDSWAIFLLGKLYIEELRDKNTGISLIKKSIELKPEKNSYKEYLAQICQ